MLKKDSPIFLQNINMIARQLFLLFKKSTTFWDNPRKSVFFDFGHVLIIYYYDFEIHLVSKQMFKTL